MEVLVTARQEYQAQLCNIMIPHMIMSFQDMYEEAARMCNNKKVLCQFQIVLKDVKMWNSNITRQHVNVMHNSCSWFNDLLAAVFVSAVKILSSVRLTTDRKKLNIKIPSNETFIHGCYENVARDLHDDPYIFDHLMPESERDQILASRMRIAIDKTLNNMLPVQEILKTNMGGRVPGDECIVDDCMPDSDDEDPDVVSDDEGIEEDVEEVLTPDEPPVEDEKKFIELKQPPIVQEDVPPDDDVLFPDAPER
jgi:hypothetical protein